MFYKAKLALTFLVCLTSVVAHAQQRNANVLIVHPAVGETINKQEKITYGLFPYYSADKFQEARFLRFLAADSARSTITLQTTFRNGKERSQPFTEREFEDVRNQIERNKMLADSLGQTYFVELIAGSSFTGVLVAQRETELEFTITDLGRITIQKANIRQLVPLTPAQAQRGWEPVGNGTRMFFAPTARNLRKGEGYVQNIDIIFFGANYGITDNFSLGVLFPLVPGLGGVLAITPKVSAPVSEKFSVGAGVLYGRAFGFGGSSGAGIGYGVATYGGADHNATLGLGYVFVDGENESTPVVVVGGATRVSRRFSILNETYITNEGFFGLVGGRIAATRLSGSLGFLYGSYIGGIYPAYVEVAYRFGKTK
ncbi:hypothetical protein MTX78_00885 [Hymenobacter tibetensis]|uniref:Uncharacterized protein n=1 Tax=Hymenobacter tibetensis TaxID=497967 RepID=A0ABY4CY25_9BACT|nr:hypothetical protein [Hymenobacter tibetensis]UOG75168.1 hypothetical protein MTX78_00885 [Hymenobacter tibetensis]